MKRSQFMTVADCAREADVSTQCIRNWIIAVEAVKSLDLEWVSYTPGYRSPALTGTGLCFAAWRMLA